MQHLEKVKGAIAALGATNTTKEANEWLVEFERSPLAWEVSDLLLRNPSNSIERFFGAKFLYSKIARQFFQISHETAIQLMQNLVQHLTQLAGESTFDTKTATYICLALAALLLQLDIAGAINQILVWLNPVISERPVLLLSLLTVLPEECDNSRILVSNETRNSFARQLSESYCDVFKFLSSLVVNSRTEEDKLAILKCASKWIALGDSVANAKDLIHFSLLCLRSDSSELFDASGDFLTVVLRRFRNKASEEEELNRQIVNTVLELQGKWRTYLLQISNEDYDEEIRDRIFSLSKLFTEVAESALNDFLTGRDNFRSEEILSQLLQCASFKNDHSIARIPLKFFYDLSREIRPHPEPVDDYDQNESPLHFVADEANRQYLRNKFAPLFSQLLWITCESLHVDKDEDLMAPSFPPDKLDARLEWKETVLDCCDVLGAESSMQLLCNHLENEIKSGLQNISWKKVEGLFATISFIIPSLSSDAIPYVPQLVTLVVNLPRDIVRLQLTSVELLGSLAKCYTVYPVLLPAAIRKLLDDIENPLLCEESSKSIMYILKSCGRVAGFPLSECYDKIVSLTSRVGDNVSMQFSCLNLLEGLMNAISDFDDAQAETLFRSTLQSQLPKVQDAIENRNYNLLSKSLDRISIIYKHFLRKSTFVHITFQEIFPVLKKCIEVFSTENCCEKVCRVYKFAIKASGVHFQNVLHSFLNILYEQFNFIPVSAFLYAASICVASFARLENGKYDSILYQFLWEVSRIFFLRIGSVNDYQPVAELVEEYYYLVGKYLQYSPSSFISSKNESATIFTAATSIVLVLNHREAQKGILVFYQRFVNIPRFWPESNPRHGEARAVVTSMAPAILSALLTLLAGKAPIYAIDEKDGCVVDVLWDLRGYDQEFEVMFFRFLFIISNIFSLGMAGFCDCRSFP